MTRHLQLVDNINVNPLRHEYPTEIPRTLWPYGDGNKSTALIIHFNLIIFLLIYIYIFFSVSTSLWPITKSAPIQGDDKQNPENSKTRTKMRKEKNEVRQLVLINV